MGVNSAISRTGKYSKFKLSYFFFFFFNKNYPIHEFVFYLILKRLVICVCWFILINFFIYPKVSVYFLRSSIYTEKLQQQIKTIYYINTVLLNKLTTQSQIKKITPKISNYSIFLFLRKSKNFLKSRWGRNRLISKLSVYLCIYVNILVVLGLHYLFYSLTPLLGVWWWLFYFVFFVTQCLFFYGKIV